MIRSPQCATHTDTLFPYTELFRCTGVLCAPGGDGIAEQFLDHAVGDQAGGDPARVRFLAHAGVIGDHVCLGDQSGGLAGDQLGVAGAEPHAVQVAHSLRSLAPHDHSFYWASALSAEAVMADPPRRPRTVRKEI